MVDIDTAQEFDYVIFAELGGQKSYLNKKQDGFAAKRKNAFRFSSESAAAKWLNEYKARPTIDGVPLQFVDALKVLQVRKWGGLRTGKNGRPKTTKRDGKTKGVFLRPLACNFFETIQAGSRSEWVNNLIEQTIQSGVTSASLEGSPQLKPVFNRRNIALLVNDLAMAMARELGHEVEDYTLMYQPIEPDLDMCWDYARAAAQWLTKIEIDFSEHEIDSLQLHLQQAKNNPLP